MRVVNIHAAKTQLSRLVAEAEAGTEIVIARAGHPLARLGPLAPPPPTADRRRLGLLAGAFTVPADFDAPLPEAELDRFEA
jgi:prevent-host-death family protein